MIILSCLAASIGVATADEKGHTQLDATYFITSHNLLDPGPEEKRDRVAISIKGEAAKSIYDAMPMSARRLGCDGKPNDKFDLTKQAGGLACEAADDGTYFCTVAIKLDTGETTDGAVCDP